MVLVNSGIRTQVFALSVGKMSIPARGTFNLTSPLTERDKKIIAQIPGIQYVDSSAPVREVPEVKVDKKSEIKALEDIQSTVLKRIVRRGSSLTGRS